jgi:hypothetical protein
MEVQKPAFVAVTQSERNDHPWLDELCKKFIANNGPRLTKSRKKYLGNPVAEFVLDSRELWNSLSKKECTMYFEKGMVLDLDAFLQGADNNPLLRLITERAMWLV